MSLEKYWEYREYIDKIDDRFSLSYRAVKFLRKDVSPYDIAESGVVFSLNYIADLANDEGKIKVSDFPAVIDYLEEMDRLAEWNYNDNSEFLIGYFVIIKAGDYWEIVLTK